MKKIAVIGSINMDMVAKANRIPKKGETISASQLSYNPGGKGANQAVAAARLGGDVTMFGCVGDDTFGKELRNNLTQNNVQTSAIDEIPFVSSGIAMIVVAENDNVITVVPGANSYLNKNYIDRHLEEILNADIILLQNEIPFDTIAYLLPLLGESQKTVIYNPAPARRFDKDLLSHVSYLTPNEHEVKIVLDDNTSSVEDFVVQYPRKLIITLGEKGLIYADKDNPLLIPAQKVNALDTTGAGDTLNGAFAFALSQKMPLKDALSFANTAAALSTTKAGAQGGMPCFKEVIK